MAFMRRNWCLWDACHPSSLCYMNGHYYRTTGLFQIISSGIIINETKTKFMVVNRGAGDNLLLEMVYIDQTYMIECVCSISRSRTIRHMIRGRNPPVFTAPESLETIQVTMYVEWCRNASSYMNDCCSVGVSLKYVTLNCACCWTHFVNK